MRLFLATDVLYVLNGMRFIGGAFLQVGVANPVPQDFIKVL